MLTIKTFPGPYIIFSGMFDTILNMIKHVTGAYHLKQNQADKKFKKEMCF